MLFPIFSSRLSRGVGRCCTSVVAALIILLLVSPVWAQEASTGTMETPAKVDNGTVQPLDPSVMGPSDDPYVMAIRPSVSVTMGTPIADRLTGVPRPVDEIGITAIDPSGFPEICTFVDVLDSAGNPIGGMTPDSFCVFQDSIGITSFTVTELKENCPTSICLVVDVSGSMSQDHKIDSAKSAAHQFVDRMDVLDRVAIVKFSDCYSLVQAFTSDKALLHNRINTLSSGGFTAALDGIWAGVDVTLPEIGSKAVIALSDGMENRSGRCDGLPDGLADGFADDSTLIVGLALGGGIPIYTISLGNTFDPQYLVGLANGSGGSYYHAPTGGDISTIYEEIKFRLCSRYLICYTSPDTIPNADCHDVIVCHLDPAQGCAPCDTGSYCEPDNPKITIQVDPGCRYSNTDLEICATVTDSDTPAESLLVKLYYRNELNIAYTDVVMNRTGNVFCYTIPGAILTCATDSIQFYVTASDGSVTVANPSSAPNIVHAVPICPPRGPLCETPGDTAMVLCDGEEICLPVSCSDPDGDLHSGPTLLSGPGVITNGQWCYTPSGPGSEPITIECTDSCGARCEASFNVSWEFNSAPICSLTTTPSPPLCTPPLHVLTFSSTDPDGDPTECINTNPNASIVGGTWQYVPTPGETVYDTIICSDPCGNECMIPIQVTYLERIPPVCVLPTTDTTIVLCDPVLDSLPVRTSIAATCELIDSSPGVLRNGWWIYQPSGDETVNVSVRCYTLCDTCEGSFMVTYDVNSAPVLIGCPEDARFSCDQGPGEPPPVNAEDDRPGVSLSFEETRTDGSCEHAYTLTRTWIAIDSCGLADTCVQIVTIYDDQAPEITCGQTDDDGFYSCGETVTLAPATARDNCDPNPTVSEFHRDSVPGRCATDYQLVITWEAVDDCGNKSYCADTITVADTTAPVCSVPNDTTIFLCAPGTEICLPVSATDDCGTATCEVFAGAGSVGPNGWCYTPTLPGEHIIGIRCTDDCENVCEDRFVVRVQINMPPLYEPIGDLRFPCDQPGDFTHPGYTDPDNNVVGELFVADTVPGSCPQEYTMSGMWIVTDSCGLADTAYQVIAIYDDTPPQISCPQDVRVACDDTTTDWGWPAATDNCDPDPTITLVSTDTIPSGTPCEANFTVIRMWSAMDACQNQSLECRQVVTVVDTIAPEVVCPIDTTIICSDLPPDAAVLINAFVPPASVEEAASRTPLPLFGIPTVTDNCNPTIQWGIVSVEPLDGPCPRLLRVGYAATDMCGNLSDTCYQMVTVIDTLPPVIVNCPPPSHLQCNEPLPPIPHPTDPIVASDDCTPDPQVTMVLIDTVAASADDHCYQIRRHYVARDLCGNVSDTCVEVFMIIDNDPPQIFCSQDVVIACERFDWAAVPGPDYGWANAEDNCDAAAFAELNRWYVTDSICANTFRIVREFISTDSCGNFATCIQNIDVRDIEPPRIQCPPEGEPIVVSCDDPFADKLLNFGPGSDPFDPPPAIDNCDPNPLVELAAVDIAVSDSCRSLVVLKWVANDECRNFSDTCYERYTVIDTTRPEITLCPEDVLIECPMSLEPDFLTTLTDSLNAGVYGWPEATDNCDTNLWVAWFPLNAPTPGNPCDFRLEIGWFAVDNCYNISDTCKQTFIFTDTTAPELIYCPPDTVIECPQAFFSNPIPAVDINDPAARTQAPDWPFPFPGPVFTDNCDSLFWVPVVSDQEQLGPCHFSFHFGIQAMDLCGNVSDTCFFSVTLIDTTAPELICPPDTMIECFDVFAATSALQTTGLVNPATRTSGDPIAPWGDPTVTDDCDTLPLWGAVALVPDPITDSCMMSFRVGFLAVDMCQNLTDTCWQTVTFFDTTGPEITCPPDTTWPCDALAGIPLPQYLDWQPPGVPGPFGTPSALDNCGPTLWRITTVDSVLQGDSLCLPAASIGYQARDLCGNLSEICYQYLRLTDDTPPELMCPDVTELACDDTTTLPWPTATDECDSLVNIQLVRVDTIPHPDGCTFDIEREFLATDDCGNTATCVHNVHVFDRTAPVIACPEPVTYSCDAVPDTFAVPTATDNCDANPVLTLVNAISGTTCGAGYERVNLWEARDACGNADTCRQVIIVVDTTAPEIVCPADTVIECPQNFPGPGEVTSKVWPYSSPTVTDNCDPQPGWDVVSQQRTDEGPCLYTIRFGLMAFDVCQNASDTCFFSATYVDTTAPVLSCPPDTTVQCEEFDPVALQANRGQGFWPYGMPAATDNCDPQPWIQLVDLRPVHGDSCPDVWRAGFIAGDNCENISDTCWQTIYVADTTAPVIDCPPPMRLYCGDSLPGYPEPHAYDNCQHGAPVQPVLVRVDTTFLSPDSCLGNIRIEVIWSATDRCGNTNSCTHVIEIIDDMPPEITCPPPTEIACDDTTYQWPWPEARDYCDPNPTVELLYTDTIPFGPCDFEVVRTFVAKDACGNRSQECRHEVRIFDREVPRLECPPNLTVACDDTTTDWGWPTAADNCDTLPRIELVHVDTSYFDPFCTAVFDVHRTWIAFDACQNPSEPCFQTVSVIDSVGPQITCPPDTTISCDELQDINAQLVQNMSDPASDQRIPFPIFGSPTLTDNCNPNWTWGMVSIDTVQSSCPTILSVGYQGIDYCGNQSEVCYQAVTIVDTLAPTVEYCPEPVYLPCDGLDTPIPAPIFHDRCTLEPVVERVRTDTVMTAGADYCYKYIHYYVATDECLNTSDTCRVEIRVTDNVAPVVECPPDLVFSCTALDTLKFADSSLGWALAKDNCDLDVVVNLVSVSTVDSLCEGTKTIVRVFAATDACGNPSDECRQIINIIDDTPPVITCGAPLTFSCDAVPMIPDSLTPPIATDDCDPNPVVTAIAGASSTTAECPQGAEMTVTWEARDACGNASTCVQTIFIADTTAPTVTCPPDTIISCDELPNGAEGLLNDARTQGLLFGVPTISDNCDSTPNWRLATVANISDTCPWVIEFGFDGIDACGNVSDTCYQLVTIIDTIAPTCVVPEDTSFFFCEPGAEICLPITITDNCLDRGTTTATVRSNGGPPGGPYVIAQGIWCHPVTQTEELTVVVSSRDACGNTCTDSFMVSIQLNEPPVCTMPTDTTIYLCDTVTYCFPVSTTDVDGNLANCNFYAQIDDGRGQVDISGDLCWFVFGTHSVKIWSECVDSCGAFCSDTVNYNFIVVDPPVCRVPDDQKLFLCNADTLLSLPYASNADSCWQVSGPGALVNGNWQYTPSGIDESFYVAISCENMCGVCTDSFYVNIDVNEPPVCVVPNDTTIYLCAPGQYCFEIPSATDADGNLVHCGVIFPNEPNRDPASDQICLWAERDTTFMMISQCTDACGETCQDTFYVHFDVDQAPVCETMNDTTIYVCDTATICIPYRSTDIDSSLESCSIQLWENDKRFGEMHGEICFFAYKNETYTAVVTCQDTCGNACTDTVFVTVVQYPLPICELPADTAFFICDPGTPISLPYGTQPLDTCTILRGPGTLGDSTWNYSATVDEEFSVVIECSNLCGSCVDSFMVSIDMNEAPTCDPHADTTIFLCEPAIVCLPITGTDVDGNLTQCLAQGDGCDICETPPSSWCFNATHDTTVEVITRCYDACNAFCEDTFYVTFEFNSPPICSIPGDTTIYLCDSGTVCFDVSIIDPDSNLAGFSWSFSEDLRTDEPWGSYSETLCYFYDESVSLLVGIAAFDECGAICYDTSYIDIVVDRTPVCENPGDQYFRLCEADTVRAWSKSTGDSCWISAGPGIFEDGVWKYLPAGDDEFDVTISCENRCGRCDETFHVVIDFNSAPICTIPNDTTIYLCDTATMCFPFHVIDPDSNLMAGIAQMQPIDPTQRGGVSHGTWEGELCPLFTESGRWMYTIWVLDSCEAACYDTSYIDVIVNRPPICGLPGDQDEFLCEPDSLIYGYQTTGDTCWIVSGPGVLEDGAWRYYADADDEFTVVISCENECGVCTDSFLVSIELNDPPVIIQPPDSTFFLCDTATFCLEAGILDPNNNLAAYSWLAAGVARQSGDLPGEGFLDTLCIHVGFSQVWTFFTYAEDSCGVVRADTTVWEFYFDRPPDCKPIEDQSFLLCEIDTVRVPYASTVDSCWISAGPGVLEDGYWKYLPSGEEEVDVTIMCANRCGECETSFHASIKLNEGPVCTIPADTTYYLCDTATFCWDVGVTDADSNLADGYIVISGAPLRDTGPDANGGLMVNHCEFIGASRRITFYSYGIDGCGETCGDTTVIDFIMNEAPVCEIPGDQRLFLCAPDTISLPYASTGDTCWLADGPGMLEDGMWKYLPGNANEDFTVVISCSNDCGVCTDSFHVYIDMNEPPVVEGPPDQTAFLCEVGDTVCIGPWIVTDPDHATCDFRDGQNGELYCFYPDTAGVYSVIRCAEDSCGAVGCDTTLITVKFNSPPVCVVPADTTIWLCGPEEVCIPFYGTDPDNNLAFCGSYGPLGRTSCESGRCPENIWCYTPQEPGPVDVFVRCTDSCGAVCETIFTVNFEFNTPPSCAVPNDTTIYLCDTTTWCFPVISTDPDGNLDMCGVGMGPFGLMVPVTPGDEYCFQVLTSQAFTFRVVCVDSCGAACEDSVTYNFVLTPPPVCDTPADQEYFLCAPDTVKVSFKETGDSCWVSSGKGFIEDGWWKYLPSGDENFTVEISCANECGVCSGSFTVSIDINEGPVCDPHSDTTIFLCQPETICLPVTGSDPDDNLVRCYSPSNDCRGCEVPGGQWCYFADRDTTVPVITICEDECGAVCVDTFWVTFNMNEAPICQAPNDTTIFQCVPTEVMIPVTALDADGNFDNCLVVNGPGTISGANWIYTPAGEETDTVYFECIDSCGAACRGQFIVTFDMNQPPICETQPPSPPRCVAQRMIVPIATEDPEGQPTECTLVEGPGELIDGVWQWDPIPGTRDTVVIHCADTCDAICEVWFEINIPSLSPPVCVLPENQEFFFCDASEIRLPVSAYNSRQEDITCEVTDGPGELIDGYWVFQATQNGTFDVTIRCSDICGDFCEGTFTITITMNSDPVCQLPGDQTFFQCTPQQIVLPYGATDVDGNLEGCELVTGPGVLDKGNWTFTPTFSGTWVVTIRCYDECEASCEASFTVTVDIDEPPVCHLPSDTTIEQCVPAQVMLPVSATFFQPGQGGGDRSRGSRSMQSYTRSTVTTKQGRFDNDRRGSGQSMAAGDIVAGCSIVAGPGELIDGYWIYTPSGDETVVVEILCVDQCGFACDGQFEVTFVINDAPICEFRTPAPSDCAPPILVVPFSATDPEQGPVTSQLLQGPGQVVDQVWSYSPIPGESFNVLIRNTDDCGLYCDIAFHIDVPAPQPPICVIPTVDQDYFLCQAGQVTAPVSATGGVGGVTCTVVDGPGSIVDGQWVYYASAPGEFDVTVECSDNCGTSCQGTFHVSIRFNYAPTCNLPDNLVLDRCESSEIVLPVSADDVDGNLIGCEIVSGPGGLVNGDWIWTPTSAGTHWVTIRCIDECGAICEGSFSVTVGANSAPVCGVGDQYFAGCDQISASVPLNTVDPDGNLKRCRVISGPGAIQNGNWVFSSVISGVYNVTIECTDSCGAVCTDDFSVVFDLNDPPVCNMHDTTIVLCGATDVVLPLDIIDPDGNLSGITLLAGPGNIVGDAWYYHLIEDTPVDLVIQAIDDCGRTCISSFRIYFQFGDLRLCDFPWQDTVFLCGPGPFCFDVPPGCDLSLGMAKVQGADMCFEATQEGTYWATVECADDCGNICHDSVSFAVVFTDLPDCGPTVTSSTESDSEMPATAGEPCDCPGRGDMNGDGFVSAEDFALMVNILLDEPVTPAERAGCETANTGDVNCDGTLDIRDVEALKTYIFDGGTTPCSRCASIAVPKAPQR